MSLIGAVVGERAFFLFWATAFDIDLCLFNRHDRREL